MGRPSSASWTARLFSEVGEVGLGVGLGQRAVGLGGLLGGGQRGLALPELGEPDGEVVQRAGEVGEVGLGVGLGQRAADVYGLLGGGQRGLALPELGEPVGEVVQRGGEVGEVGLGLASASARRMSTACWAGASAAWRCPSSARWLARLFSEAARSGR